MDLVEVIDARAFAITERIEPNVIQIGNTNSRMVIIPNFFVYPDQVREYALNCKYFKDPEVPENPGFINYFSWNELQVLQLTKLLRNEFMGDYRTSHDGFAPVISLQTYNTINRYQPHIDYFHYAGICPLNLDDELSNNVSGTSFFRHKKTGEEFTALANYRHKETLDSDPSDWEVYHTQYHNYNEYIFYESALFHCAYWKKENWTTKYPRFTFNTFTW